MGHKITRVIPLILFLVIMIATIPLGYAYEWSPDMRLTWNVESDWMPSIAQASDGKIWVVWHSYRTGNANIFYRVYDPTQVHPWSSETRLTADPNNDLTPSIMQAKDGNIWVVWSTNINGNYDIFYKIFDGVSWSLNYNLTMDPNVDELPSIMQTANGTIWLSWSTNRTGNYDVFYKTSSDNGTTWLPDTPLPYPAPEDDWDPSIVETADGEIWVVWVRNYDIFYKVYDGVSWSSADNGLVTDPNLDRHPSIMQGVDGKIWVVWDSDRISEQDDIYYKVHDTLWSSANRLTTDLKDDLMPSVMQTMNQTIWIVWTSSRLNNYDIYYRTTEIPQPHDVAIFSVLPSKATVYQGQTVSIEVVAQNHGTNPETFNVTCYANSTSIGSQTIGLAHGQLYPITFSWNTSTTALGNYTISATATTVPNETDTADNIFIDGKVHVKFVGDIPADIDGDGDVDPDDFYLFSGAYGSSVGDPGYNPDADLDGDGDVDPDDFYIFSGNYGTSI